MDMHMNQMDQCISIFKPIKKNLIMENLKE